MKILELDYDYYYYPQGISCLEDFITYVNDHYNSFIELVCFDTENCVFPYLISEETKNVYVNTSTVQKINEAEATLICRKDYDDRLGEIVKNKCVDCIHYEDENDDDNLAGHREKISLDGKCWGYERKDKNI